MERSPVGQEIYVSSMEKSAQDKARIFPFVREGLIVDIGAGAGPVTELLHERFPTSQIIAVDNSPDMISLLQKRFALRPRVEVVRKDAETFKYPLEADTILFVSTLHEVFSFNNYSHEAVIGTLKNAYGQLVSGGRLIIRDGVHPEQENLYLRPKRKESHDRFFKFVKEFKVRPMVYTQGTFHGDSFVQHQARSYKEFEGGDFLIEMHSQDISELLSKYFYEEINWKAELKEQFGIWTLREYQHILIELGFFIVYSETYVLPYLLETHYSRDFDVLKMENGQLQKISYPPSTMILVAEKP